MPSVPHTARLALLTGLIALGAVAVQARGADMQRPAFADLDLDGDGSLTAEELQAARSVRAAERFATADTDGDGLLTAEELTAAAEARRTSRQQGRIERMIGVADTDGDGALSAAELEAFRGQRGDRRGRAFDRLDANADGVIDAEEFAQARPRGGKGPDHGQRHGTD